MWLNLTRTNGRRVLVNSDQIYRIEPRTSGAGATLHFAVAPDAGTKKSVIVTETFEIVAAMLFSRLNGQATAAEKVPSLKLSAPPK